MGEPTLVFEGSGVGRIWAFSAADGVPSFSAREKSLFIHKEVASGLNSIR